MPYRFVNASDSPRSGPLSRLLLAATAMVATGALVAACTFDDGSNSGPVQVATEVPATEDQASADESDADVVEVEIEAEDPETGDAEPNETGTEDPVAYDPVIVETYPHDPAAYTQGLEFVDGLLLESTGLVGESTIRLVDPTTGTVLESSPLAQVFGEGTTVVGDEVFQLTWTEQTLVIHDLDGLVEQRRLTYSGEGWGLCNDGDRLVMSNGSSELTFRDPTSFEPTATVGVTDENGSVEQLNELECVGDRVWANIYQSNRVVEIDPATGRVVGSIDLSALVPDEFRGDNNNVLNGIAYNAETGRFWVTGKRWPVMYELELVPVN